MAKAAEAMDRREMMREAAEKAGMAWPLDGKALELSEMVFRGLDYGASVVRGEAEKKDMRAFLEELQRKADET